MKSIRLSLCVMLLVVPNVDAQSSRWSIERRAAADLWYHALAIIDFGAPDRLGRYQREYVDRVREAKSAMAVGPTQLDEMAGPLKNAFESDGRFQILHSVPLLLPTASAESLFMALDYVILEGAVGAKDMDPLLREGADRLKPAFVDARARRILQLFVELLRDEWTTFYAAYWPTYRDRTASTFEDVRSFWRSRVEPALGGYLRSRDMTEGSAILSPALSALGMLEASGSYAPVAAVWFPEHADAAEYATFSLVARLCGKAVDDAMDAPDVEGTQEAWVNATARCGHNVLRHADTALAAEFAAAIVAMAERAGPIAAAFPLQAELEESLSNLTAPGASSGSAAPTAATGWSFQPRESTDLWYHTMAVIAADQPGPLGLYSADYARDIRERKRDRGLYPTRLDSLAPDLNKRIGDGAGTRQIVHFLPLYAPTLGVEGLLTLLEAPDAADAIKTFGSRLDGRTANILRDIGRVMRHEYEVFFQDYWKEYEATNRYRFEALQTFWDRALGAVIDGYLDDRRLNGGLAMPSPPVGPEGRILNRDPTNRSTNVVAMQFPIRANRPAATAFFFLKELCFLIVQDRAFGLQGRATPDFENQQRIAAVRCGAIILDEYDPVLALQYRRAFLEAVGAELIATRVAFERVYYLDPATLRRVEAQVLFPR